MSDETTATEQVTNAAPKTWREALFSTPGPKTTGEAVTLAVKGVCMGTADIIPGVSGGTMAFISGIYESLLAAVASFDTEFLKLIFSGKIKEALARVHLRFIVCLLVGIVAAFISSAKLVHYLMEHEIVLTMSLFFGLILSSIYFVASHASKWSILRVVQVIAGAVAAYYFTGMIPVETPHALWFIFICAIIAICAMILPGISGSFLLLILGQYMYILGAVKNPFSVESLSIIVVYIVGSIVGLTGFVRVLRWTLNNWHDATMAVLTGLMIGSMRKIWPWKQQVETLVYQSSKGIKEKILVEQNVWPTSYAQEYMQTVHNATKGVGEMVTETTTVAGSNPQWVAAIVLMVIGVVLVFVLESWSNRESRKEKKVELEGK